MLNFSTVLHPRRLPIKSMNPNLSWRNLTLRERGHLLAQAFHHDLSSMKLLMWNTREAGSNLFREYLLHHVDAHKPGIAIIVETKLGGERAKGACKKLPFKNFIVVDTEGLRVEYGCCGIRHKFRWKLFPTTFRSSM